MDTTESILARWPTMAELASDLGLEPTVIRMWKARDAIPPEYFPGIVASARTRGIDGVTLDLLFATRSKRDPVSGLRHRPRTEPTTP